LYKTRGDALISYDGGQFIHITEGFDNILNSIVNLPEIDYNLINSDQDLINGFMSTSLKMIDLQNRFHFDEVEIFIKK